VPTAAGALYDIDTRLRPWGAKGPLALSVAGFARYLAEEAETWEQMALARARVVAGPAETVAALIAARLAAPRDADALRRAVLAMRADVAAAKPPQGRFDVKLAPGGLVDLEFLVHHAQLAHGIGLHPELPAALRALVAAGRLPAALIGAHDLLTRTLVWLRLLFAGGRVPDPLPDAVVALLGQRLVTPPGAANMSGFADALAMARDAVRMAWAHLARPPDHSGDTGS
jgi:glutamate-ammonia-ligase adenylyltransferase